MEVKIGVQHVGRELTVESNETAEAVQQKLADAVAGDGVFTLADVKGRTVVVPAVKVAYIEIGVSSPSTVGFR